ncbi:unnamed protein product [Heligmosomoides polygyrus]|uniref:Integrase core domain containing protein n=1 Tax=Heligmosomoides polygyrus TaxID=6339 RepID=A0A183GRB4_HELPZ|nr:unnamed protein product [Heligmosomoides polygyrus]
MRAACTHTSALAESCQDDLAGLKGVACTIIYTTDAVFWAHECRDKAVECDVVRGLLKREKLSHTLTIPHGLLTRSFVPFSIVTAEMRSHSRFVEKEEDEKEAEPITSSEVNMRDTELESDVGPLSIAINRVAGVDLMTGISADSSSETVLARAHHIALVVC